MRYKRANSMCGYSDKPNRLSTTVGFDFRCLLDVHRTVIEHKPEKEDQWCYF